MVGMIEGAFVGIVGAVELGAEAVIGAGVGAEAGSVVVEAVAVAAGADVVASSMCSDMVDGAWAVASVSVVVHRAKNVHSSSAVWVVDVD